MKQVPRWISFVLCALGALILVAPADAATSYAETTRQLQDECRNSPLLQIVSLGKSASGSRTIWLVRIGLPDPQRTRQRRIFALCRQHGDEPASTEALLQLTRQVAVHGLGAWPGGKHVVLYVVPMVNPDGADAGTRVNAAGADLNRDWGVFSQPETRAVYQSYKTIRPDLVLDLHSWDTTDPFRRMCIEGPRSGDPSLIERTLTDFQHRAIVDASASKEAIASTTYSADADATLAHRFFWTVKKTPALLFETDAGSRIPALLVRRTQAAYDFLTWTISDAANSSACWYQFTKAAARSDDQLFMHAASAADTRPVPAPSRPRIAWQTWFALICFGVGVFWRYGLARREQGLPRRTHQRAKRTQPSRKERLRAARIEAARRTRTPYDHHRPYFRFAQPDQRSRDPRRPDLSRRDLAGRVHQQVH